jgi:hypothetical protein
MGKQEARAFYITPLGWYTSTFDNVDRAARDQALSDKPDMFKMWLFKLSSTFCATGKNMGRWFGSDGRYLKRLSLRQRLYHTVLGIEKVSGAPLFCLFARSYWLGEFNVRNDFISYSGNTIFPPSRFVFAAHS